MKSTYHITARQLVLLALATSVFAASAVLLYDRFGSDLLGRWVGARTEKTLNASKSIESITNPSVATDEQNNREIYTAMSPGVVNITSTVYVQDLSLIHISEPTRPY